MRQVYSALFIAFTALHLPGMVAAQCTTATDIITVAGNHTNGYSGDGGEGTAAQIGSPYAVAADGAGNFFIADYFNNVVRKVSASGTISTVAGTGTAGYNGDNISAITAQLNCPAGVTLDAAGNLYIADKFNERIRRVDALTGDITSIAGNGGHGGWDGAEFGNGGPATAASLTYPVSVALDCSGNMYVADWGSQTVRKINTLGVIDEFAGTHKGGYNGDGIPALTADLNAPTGVAADCDGNVFIADTWNNRVRKVDNTGMISTVAGNGTAAYTGDGGAATAASIWGPWGITLDGCGNLYICDYDNYVVRKVTGGTISTFAGTGVRGYAGDGAAANEADMYLPSSVAIDGENVYIADYGNMVVRLVGSVGYSPRAFAGGTTQTMHVCQNAASTNLDAMMATEHKAGRTETWTVSGMPVHGTLTQPGEVVAENGMVAPSGLIYTPEAGFTGKDEFTVLMNDGSTSASTTISVVVDALPEAGVISGNSVVKKGSMTLVTSGNTGGTWSSSDTRIATVDAEGNVTGITNGIVTISYTVSNTCGAKTATGTILSEISEVPADRGVVFPNPNKGTFRYDFMGTADNTVQIVARDITGRVIYKESVAAVKGINTLNITLPATVQRPSMIWVSMGDDKKSNGSTAVMITE